MCKYPFTLSHPRHVYKYRSSSKIKKSKRDGFMINKIKMGKTKLKIGQKVIANGYEFVVVDIRNESQVLISNNRGSTVKEIEFLTLI